jgi:hypothetical protein
MKKYLVVETVPDTAYVAGRTVLVYPGSAIDQKAVEVLGDKIKLISDVNRRLWSRPPWLQGKDPQQERLKWARYHKAKRAGKAKA